MSSQNNLMSVQRKFEKRNAELNEKMRKEALAKQKIEDEKKAKRDWLANNAVAILALIVAIIALIKP